MKQVRLIMGMPIQIEIADKKVKAETFEKVFDYFQAVDNRFSTYKDDSEISRINNGLAQSEWSQEMKTVLDLCEQTKQQTSGYFDIVYDNKLDPSGLVKGWAINNAAQLLQDMGYRNFYIDAGGDVHISGHKARNRPWRVGLRNPFDRQQNIKIIEATNKGVATSGTYIRGQHIYNPKTNKSTDDIAAITVIGPDIYNADRFATAAFAMGQDGIKFIELLPGYEAYMVNKNKTATMTSGFDEYVVES